MRFVTKSGQSSIPIGSSEASHRSRFVISRSEWITNVRGDAEELDPLPTRTVVARPKHRRKTKEAGSVYPAFRSNTGITRPGDRDLRLVPPALNRDLDRIDQFATAAPAAAHPGIELGGAEG